jgi:hypothetical protein
MFVDKLANSTLFLQASNRSSKGDAEEPIASELRVFMQELTNKMDDGFDELRGELNELTKKVDDGFDELRGEVKQIKTSVSRLETSVSRLETSVSRLETDYGAVVERAVREALKPRYGEVYLRPLQLSSLRNLMGLTLTDDEKVSPRSPDIINMRARVFATHLLSSGVPACLTTYRPTNNPSAMSRPMDHLFRRHFPIVLSHFERFRWPSIKKNKTVLSHFKTKRRGKHLRLEMSCPVSCQFAEQIVFHLKCDMPSRAEKAIPDEHLPDKQPFWMLAHYKSRLYDKLCLARLVLSIEATLICVVVTTRQLADFKVQCSIRTQRQQNSSFHE